MRCSKLAIALLVGAVHCVKGRADSPVEADTGRLQCLRHLFAQQAVAPTTRQATCCPR